MIRRPTFILLIVFVVVVGVAVFLTKTPTGIGLMQTETPTPTVLPKLLSGWPVDQAVKIDVQSRENGKFQLERPSEGGWAVVGLAQPTDTGKVEQLLSSITALDAIDTMPASTAPEAVGLDQPAYTLTFTSSGGDREVVQIGNATPTGSGYYVRVGQGDIVLARKSSLDEAIGLLSVEQLAVQPTEMAVPTGAAALDGTSPAPAP